MACATTITATTLACSASDSGLRCAGGSGLRPADSSGVPVSSAAGSDCSERSWRSALTSSRIVATFPVRADASLRSIDCAWDVAGGPASATVTPKGLLIDIDLRGVDHAFSGSMKLHYKKTIPADVLDALPRTALRFPVEPVFVYRAAGVRPKS